VLWLAAVIHMHTELDKVMRMRWIKQIQKTRGNRKNPSEHYTYVCSEHFAADSYQFYSTLSGTKLIYYTHNQSIVLEYLR
jgi:hypothetical protein